MNSQQSRGDALLKMLQNGMQCYDMVIMMHNAIVFQYVVTLHMVYKKYITRTNKVVTLDEL